MQYEERSFEEHLDAAVVDEVERMRIPAALVIS
jgi:hypothetical protein